MGDRCECNPDDMNPLDSYSTYYHTFNVYNGFFGKSCHWARIYSEDKPEMYSGWFIFDHGAPWENNVYVIRENAINRIVPDTKKEEKVRDVSLFTDFDQTGMREMKWLKYGCEEKRWWKLW